jgi:hypothetical protein
MNAAELMADFAGRGVTLQATPGGNLRFSPKSKLGPDDVELLKAHRDSILNILTRKLSPLSPLSPLPQNPDRRGDCAGDRSGDSNKPRAVTTVTVEGDLPEFVRRRYEKAAALGLVAKWSVEFGYVSTHDPTTGEWHDLLTKEAPDWAVREARRRKELYKDGNHRAYDLTAADMEEIWRKEQAEMWDHPAVTDKGVVYEDYLEEDLSEARS